jgi:cytochrome c oxidase subunit 1
MFIAMRAWKRENPDGPVPLAMFATVANAVMWLWTTVGVAVELIFQVIPAALGLVQTIDVACRARCSPGRCMRLYIFG